MVLTVIVPFWNGHTYLDTLLSSVPDSLPVILINDFRSTPPDTDRWPNVRVMNLTTRGYFTGACNAGFAACDTDVLILNQDGELLPGWEQALEQRDQYGIIGDAAKHPGWPNGYVQGTFMYISRDTLDLVGNFNPFYPLWGSTCEFQLRACRQGVQALPLDASPYFKHARGKRQFGTAISRTLTEEPKNAWRFATAPPAVSVVITTYNFKGFLEQAVNSVLEQTFQSTEIIIVDDGSTDGTEELGRQLHDPWKGIHYIRQQNQGASAAANTGIEKATGWYVTVLDGDDWMAPTRLEKMLHLAYMNPHSVIYDGIIFVHEDHSITYRMPAYDFEKLLYRNCMHKAILYEKRAWKEVGGYSLEMNDGREDWEFNIKLGLAGYCGVYLDEPLYMYRRQHQGRTQLRPKERSYFKEKIVRLHPGVYYKGDRPMPCCGKRAIPTVAADYSVSIRSTAATSEPPDSTWTMVEYTGTNTANQTISGPSLTRYKYGRNERKFRFWVHPYDIEFMLATGMFVVYIKPSPSPSPEPEPQAFAVSVAEESKEEEVSVVIEPEKEPEVETVISITWQAQALLDKHGVSIEDVPHEDSKVSITDVRSYLSFIGISDVS